MGIHSQPHALMCLWTWYSCKFDIQWQLAKPISRDSAAGCSWGSAKPWWVAVISGCDVGDGDSGGTSSTLCASAGQVESRFCVCSVSDFLINFSCNCSNIVYFQFCHVGLVGSKLQVNNIQCCCFISNLANKKGKVFWQDQVLLCLTTDDLWGLAIAALSFSLRVCPGS